MLVSGEVSAFVVADCVFGLFSPNDCFCCVFGLAVGIFSKDSWNESWWEWRKSTTKISKKGKDCEALLLCNSFD